MSWIPRKLFETVVGRFKQAIQRKEKVLQVTPYALNKYLRHPYDDFDFYKIVEHLFTMDSNTVSSQTFMDCLQMIEEDSDIYKIDGTNIYVKKGEEYTGGFLHLNNVKHRIPNFQYLYSNTYAEYDMNWYDVDDVKLNPKTEEQINLQIVLSLLIAYIHGCDLGDVKTLDIKLRRKNVPFAVHYGENFYSVSEYIPVILFKRVLMNRDMIDFYVYTELYAQTKYDRTKIISLNIAREFPEVQVLLEKLTENFEKELKEKIVKMMDAYVRSTVLERSGFVSFTKYDSWKVNTIVDKILNVDLDENVGQVNTFCAEYPWKTGYQKPGYEVDMVKCMEKVTEKYLQYAMLPKNALLFVDDEKIYTKNIQFPVTKFFTQNMPIKWGNVEKHFDQNAYLALYETTNTCKMLNLCDELTVVNLLYILSSIQCLQDLNFLPSDLLLDHKPTDENEVITKFAIFNDVMRADHENHIEHMHKFWECCKIVVDENVKGFVYYGQPPDGFDDITVYVWFSNTNILNGGQDKKPLLKRQFLNKYDWQFIDCLFKDDLLKNIDRDSNALKRYKRGVWSALFVHRMLTQPNDSLRQSMVIPLSDIMPHSKFMQQFIFIKNFIGKSSEEEILRYFGLFNFDEKIAPNSIALYYFLYEVMSAIPPLWKIESTSYKSLFDFSIKKYTYFMGKFDLKEYLKYMQIAFLLFRAEIYSESNILNAYDKAIFDQNKSVRTRDKQSINIMLDTCGYITNLPYIFSSTNESPIDFGWFADFSKEFFHSFKSMYGDFCRQSKHVCSRNEKEYIIAFHNSMEKYTLKKRIAETQFETESIRSKSDTETIKRFEEYTQKRERVRITLQDFFSYIMCNIEGVNCILPDICYFDLLGKTSIFGTSNDLISGLLIREIRNIISAILTTNIKSQYFLYSDGTFFLIMDKINRIFSFIHNSPIENDELYKSLSKTPFGSRWLIYNLDNSDASNLSVMAITILYLREIKHAFSPPIVNLKEVKNIEKISSVITELEKWKAITEGKFLVFPHKPNVGLTNNGEQLLPNTEFVKLNAEEKLAYSTRESNIHSYMTGNVILSEKKNTEHSAFDYPLLTLSGYDKTLTSYQYLMYVKRLELFSILNKAKSEEYFALGKVTLRIYFEKPSMQLRLMLTLKRKLLQETNMLISEQIHVHDFVSELRKNINIQKQLLNEVLALENKLEEEKSRDSVMFQQNNDMYAYLSVWSNFFYPYFDIPYIDMQIREEKIMDELTTLKQQFENAPSSDLIERIRKLEKELPLKIQDFIEKARKSEITKPLFLPSSPLSSSPSFYSSQTTPEIQPQSVLQSLSTLQSTRLSKQESPSMLDSQTSSPLRSSVPSPVEQSESSFIVPE